MKPLRGRIPFAVLLLVGGAAGDRARAAESFTRIADFRSLSREEADRASTLRVRGVVTWRSSDGRFTVQDDSAGIWIAVGRARQNKAWATQEPTLALIQVGQLVEIEGGGNPGGYAPSIVPKTIRIVGGAPLPQARPMNPARFFSGAEDSLRIEVHGVVQGFQPTNEGWLLHLDANPGRFMAEFPTAALPNPSALVDAEVRITGVAVPGVNTRGEITTPRVFSSAASELVIEAPATPAFAAPLVPLNQLLAFRPEPIGPHQLRVMGTVAFALPGKFLYLQDGNSAVRVETRSTEAFAPGDRVEAAGFVDMTRYVGMLVEAQVRKIGRGLAPAAVEIGPEQIIAINAWAVANGELAKPHDFDGHLVRFRANLLAVQSAVDAGQAWRRLTLQRGEMLVGAMVLATEAEALDSLLPGSVLEVTGIVELEYAPVDMPRRTVVPTHLAVVLRRAADITVVRQPSWWTVRRLLATIAVVAVALGAALLWVWQLRRQVRRKAQQLATEMSARRDAAIEFQATLRERIRLAANLHDTLLQTLGGIGFQIEACEAEAAAPRPMGKDAVHLPLARRMLDHAVDEVRGSVWALRSLPLHGLALPDALQSMVQRVGAGHRAGITVHTEGDLSRVSDFVAGNLLLVAQEALNNALKHGEPRRISLEAKLADKSDRLALIVRDDGTGFVAGKRAGAGEGHFGLAGMRERIERLNGTLGIDSAPGQGTTIQVEVPLRAYDEDLA